ncbi:hypothetical protein OIV83_003467 [Microbotryomycetes sp. JL201]|nr:hypothetical protein OIV83_003467 [Microbotryomycetes sp. JL201]
MRNAAKAIDLRSFLVFKFGTFDPIRRLGDHIHVLRTNCGGWACGPAPGASFSKHKTRFSRYLLLLVIIGSTTGVRLRYARYPPRSLASAMLNSRASSDVEPPASSADAISVLGPVLLGDACNLVLFGLLLSSFTNFVKSSAWRASSRKLRCTIVAVILVVGAIVGLQTYDLWYFGTLQSRELSTLLRGTWPEAFEPVLAGLVGAIVESILVTRASRFIQLKRIRVPLLVIAALTILTGFLGSVGVTVWLCLFYRDPLWEPKISGLPTFNNCMATFLVCSASVDLAISVTYIVSLRKRIAGFNKSTDSALVLIMRLTLRSALYTAVVAIAGAACSLAFDSYTIKTIDVAWAFLLPLPSLYALSMFTTLDVRNRLSDHFRSSTIPAATPAFLTTDRPVQPITLTKLSGLSSQAPPVSSTLAQTSFDMRTGATSTSSVSFVPVAFPILSTSPSANELQTPKRSVSMSSIRDVIRQRGQPVATSISVLKNASPRRTSKTVDIDLENALQDDDETEQKPVGIFVKVERFVVAEQEEDMQKEGV